MADERQDGGWVIHPSLWFDAVCLIPLLAGLPFYTSRHERDARWWQERFASIAGPEARDGVTVLREEVAHRAVRPLPAFLALWTSPARDRLAGPPRRAWMVLSRPSRTRSYWSWRCGKGLRTGMRPTTGCSVWSVPPCWPCWRACGQRAWQTGGPSTPSYAEEDAAQALDQFLNTELGRNTRGDPAARWTTADDGMHVLALLLHDTLRRGGFDPAAGSYADFLARALSDANTWPRDLEARYLELTATCRS